ncbi:MAG: DUF2269 family protein [Anaerolineae bacterium]|nr:DUF2269 family protein [Anaerolineae bacterium]
MNILRVIFLVIHIISAGLWIAQFPVSLILDRVRRTLAPEALTAFRVTQGQVLSGLGQMGGMGILVSGFGLIWADGWGLFNLTAPTPSWLVLKQVFYVIAFGIVGALVIPGQAQMRKAAATVAQGNPPADILAIENRAIMASHVVNLIVLINIILAVWKPFIG